MKKVKLAIVTLMLGVATYGGIQTYEHLTMTDAEQLMMENVGALTSESSGLCLGSGTSHCPHGGTAWLVLGKKKDTVE